MPRIPVFYPDWSDSGPMIIARRHTYGTPRTDQAFSYHTHGFAEAFWIERGRCLHTVNGVEQLLAPGDLVFIRPTDVHVGHSPTAEGFTLMNVMIHGGASEILRRRYGITAAAWPWWNHEQPRLAHLSAEQRDHLALVVAELDDQAGTVQRDLVVLALVQAMTTSIRLQGPAEAPAWLREALFETDEPPLDAAALAARCGFGVAHVNRTIRRLFGCTASELLLRRRLARAAHALALAGNPIIQVALDAGFANLAWFHRAFRARYGCTPRHYRLSAQREE